MDPFGRELYCAQRKRSERAFLFALLQRPGRSGGLEHVGCGAEGELRLEQKWIRFGQEPGGEWEILGERKRGDARALRRVYWAAFEVSEESVSSSQISDISPDCHL